MDSNQRIEYLKRRFQKLEENRTVTLPPISPTNDDIKDELDLMDTIQENISPRELTSDANA